MERIIDVTLVLRAAVIVFHRCIERLAAMLYGKRHYRGGAAKDGRQAARLKIVGHDRAAGGKSLRPRLIQMAMGVYPARQYQLAAGIDGFCSAAEVEPERCNFSVANTDVGTESVCGGSNRAASYDQIEWLHFHFRTACRRHVETSR